MSTPNNAPPGQPASSATKYPTSYAAHAVSTPLPYGGHVHGTSATSTPRSVPSPAVARSSNAAAAKTPASGHGGTPVKSSALGSGASSVTMQPSLSQVSNTSSGGGGGQYTGMAGLGGFSGPPSSVTLGGLSATGLGVSPSAMNALNFASPAALAGLDMGTPSLLDPNAAMGGQAMSMSLSELGIPGPIRRNEDEERKVKLEGVLGKLLGKRKRPDQREKDSTSRRLMDIGTGRVSDEGVRRVGKWVGLDVDVEAKYDSMEFEGDRTVTIAGRNAVLVDVKFEDHLPQKVQVSFSSESPAVTAHEGSAGRLLLDDLTPLKGQHAINTKLDRFALNLQSLARLDKLSSSQLNCIEAVTGVYTSLRRLYSHELETAKTSLQGKGDVQDAKIEREVVNRRSGKPSMHSNGRVGLSLDYWIDELPATRPEPAKDSDAMDIDGDTKAQSQSYVNRYAYSLELTAKANDPTTYPALRSSSEWLSSSVVKPSDPSNVVSDVASAEEVVDWLEPPQALIGTDQADTMNTGDEHIQRLPDVCFTARLHPPLVLPWSVAGNILHSVGLPSMPTTDHLTSYEALLLGKDALQSTTRTGPSFKNGRSIYVPSLNKNEEHQHALYVQQPQYGFLLEEIPFAHPRDIVQQLPVLRQWAFLGTLLKTSFEAVNDSRDIRTNGDLNGHPSSGIIKSKHADNKMSLEDLLNDDGPQSSLVTVDTTLITPNDNPALAAPTPPTLAVMFALTRTQHASVKFAVLPNAKVEVQYQDIFVDNPGVNADQEDAESHGQKNANAAKLQAMARALEICGDIGVWVEWMKKRYA